MCTLRAAPSRHTSGHQKKNMHDTQGVRFKACKELHNMIDFFDRYHDAHIWLHVFFERLQILHPRVGISGFGLRVHFLLAVVSFAWTVCTKEVCCIICLVSQPWNASCIDNIFFSCKIIQTKIACYCVRTFVLGCNLPARLYSNCYCTLFCNNKMQNQSGRQKRKIIRTSVITSTYFLYHLISNAKHIAKCSRQS